MTIDMSSMDALIAKLDATRTALSRLPTSAPSRLDGGTVAAGGAGGIPGAKSIDFGQLLKQTIAGINDSHGQAMGLAERFQLGDPKVSLEETMVALSKANIEFQQLVQVRNRVIAAYHDVMNMQI